MNREQKKIGRNDKCDCGSGKKYKVCCLNNREALLQQQREDRERLYQTGRPIDEETSQRVKRLYDWFQNDSEYGVFGFNIIDVSHILTPETYGPIQLANMTAHTIMIAERRDESDAVFDKRTDDGRDYCNMMVLFRGAFYIFYDTEIGSEETAAQIKKMVHVRLNNQHYKGVE